MEIAQASFVNVLPAKKLGLSQTWSHPFCSRLWVGSSKGLKPVVTQ